MVDAQLDAILVEAFDVFQNIQDMMQLVQKHQQAGFMHFAELRVRAGPFGAGVVVSPDRFPSVMRASRVCRVEVPDEPTPTASSIQLTLVEAPPPPPPAPPAKRVEFEQEPESVLRNRRAPQRDEKGPERADKSESESTPPLLWFGGMPPRALRLAQCQFTQAVELLGQVASARVRLAVLCDEFARLKDLPPLPEDGSPPTSVPLGAPTSTSAVRSTPAGASVIPSELLEILHRRSKLDRPKGSA
eukprot:gnl/Spiro4/12521_TR6617_c0_g1_i1.p1 gnl/Spiro4/12521_TR6617_c0_g1~~gnl/Spiro4/12521_TR6617_c0_g1_i1.p1  ORF type:complete len:266 (-),score=57.21 gnl/Spiro4/12521_TR6617_c0_g1_i1:20-754(-)